MCTIVDVSSENNPTSINTVGELRVHFEVLPEDFDIPQGDEYCLCNTDVEAVLKRSGLPYAKNEWGYEIYDSA